MPGHACPFLPEPPPMSARQVRQRRSQKGVDRGAQAAPVSHGGGVPHIAGEEDLSSCRSRGLREKTEPPQIIFAPASTLKISLMALGPKVSFRLGETMLHGPAQRRVGYSRPRDTCAPFHIPRGLAALLDVIEEGIPRGVGLGLPEPLPGHPRRLCCRPRLLGDIDLDDLTAAHRLCYGLARRPNGFVASRGFNRARRPGRD